MSECCSIRTVVRVRDGRTCAIYAEGLTPAEFWEVLQSQRLDPEVTSKLKGKTPRDVWWEKWTTRTDKRGRVVFTKDDAGQSVVGIDLLKWKR